MKNYFVYILFFILYYFPLKVIAQENNSNITVNEQTSPQALEKGSKTDKDPSLSNNQENVVIKNVNNMIYSQEVGQDGYSQAILTGKVYIIYGQYHIWSDQMIIRFKNEKAEVLTATGNVFLEDTVGGQKTVAQKIFIYLKNKNMMLLDSFNIQENMRLTAGSLKSGTNSFITITHVSLTTSSHLYPHYVIYGDKGWIEKNNDFILYGSHIQVGQDPLFSMPLFFNVSYGTGIISALIYNYYLGFISNNTYTKQTDTYKEVFMFDYYQKLGQYVGNTYTRNDIGDLVTHVGLAYDKHFLFQDGYIQNIFEQMPGQGNSAGRSFRYNLFVDYQNDIITPEPDNPEGFKLSFKGAYKEMSDPFFANQFEEGRKDKFSLQDLMFPSDEDDLITRISNSNDYSTEGRIIDLSFIYSFLGFTGEIRHNATYLLTPKQSEEAQNTFAASYYENTLSSLTLPEISLRKNFLLHRVENDLGEGQTFKMPISLDINSQFGHNRYYETGNISSTAMKTNHNVYFTMPINYVIDKKFTINWALSTRYQLGYGGNGAYRNTLIDSYYNTLQHTVDTNYSPSFIFSLLDSKLTTNFTTNLKTNYSNRNQKTEDANGNQVLNDKSNTYTTIGQTIGETITTSWSSENLYYQGSLIAEYNYVTSNKAGVNLPTEQRVDSQKHAYSSSLNIFKSTLKVSAYDQVGNTIAKDLEKGDLNLSLTSTAVPYVTVTNNYRFNRYLEKSATNSFNASFIIPLRINVGEYLWFNSVNMEFAWSTNYFDPTQDYLTYRFYLDFNISENWNFNLSLNGRNYQLFRYGASSSSGLYVNFWVDLFKSLAFWSADLRQQSNFKMDNFAFAVSHDLDEWLLKASAEFAPKLGRTGAYYFESQFYIEVILKDLDALSAPKISQGNKNNDV